MPIYWDARRKCRRVVVWHLGHPHERSVRGTLKQAQRVEAQLRLSLGSIVPGSRVTVGQLLCDHYGPWCQRQVRASTWAVRRYQLASLCGVLGDHAVPALDLGVLDQYCRARTDDGVRATTINSELARLYTALAWARERGYAVPQLPRKRLRERGRPRVHWYTESDLQRLYWAARPWPWLVSLVIVAANTGMRADELLECEWGWVDLDRRLISIPVCDSWQPKDDEPREVPISDAA